MKTRSLLLFLLLSSCSAFGADRLRVLTTIKPLQLIALAVTGGGADVDLLLSADVSPHDYQLKPSDRAKLAGAEVVFWVGPGLETFLERALTSMSAQIRVEAFQPNGGHAIDAHIWMDPQAAINIARQMSITLARIRPAQAELWRGNVQKLETGLIQLDQELTTKFGGIKQGRGYLVSHDAFAGFERRYGLQHTATLSDGHELPPGPRRMMDVRALIERGEIGCVLLEPQYDRKVIDAVIGQSLVKRVQIDPLAKGVRIDASPSSADAAVLAVTQFYRGVGQAMADCVSR
jgi:zinc transport system substrate-binding protein